MQCGGHCMFPSVSIRLCVVLQQHGSLPQAISVPVLSPLDLLKSEAAEPPDGSAVLKSLLALQ